MKIWIHISGKQQGPFDKEDLPVDIMTAGTPVWYDGLQKWTPAGVAAETAALFSCTLPTAEKEPKCPPTYLVWSILITLCCCNVAGLVPLVYGSIVSSRFRAHDYEGARKASRITEWWVIIAFVLGLMMFPFLMIIWY